MKILLGTGLFSIGGTQIGLTKGGGEFNLERTIEPIEADGDFGFVKERMQIKREVPTLAINTLLFDSSIYGKYIPGVSITPTPAVTPTEDVMTGTLEISASDFNDVSWVGFTKDGKGVTITVKNAINMGDVNIPLEDKVETVVNLLFTGTYLDASRTTPPWEIKWAK